MFCSSSAWTRWSNAAAASIQYETFAITSGQLEMHDDDRLFSQYTLTTAGWDCQWKTWTWRPRRALAVGPACPAGCRPGPERRGGCHGQCAGFRVRLHPPRPAFRVIAWPGRRRRFCTQSWQPCRRSPVATIFCCPSMKNTILLTAKKQIHA